MLSALPNGKKVIGKHLLTHLADTVASKECNETIRYYAADAASLSLYASPANCEVFKEQVPYKDLVAFMKSAKDYRFQETLCEVLYRAVKKDEHASLRSIFGDNTLVQGFEAIKPKTFEKDLEKFLILFNSKISKRMITIVQATRLTVNDIQVEPPAIQFGDAALSFRTQEEEDSRCQLHYIPYKDIKDPKLVDNEVSFSVMESDFPEVLQNNKEGFTIVIQLPTDGINSLPTALRNSPAVAPKVSSAGRCSMVKNVLHRGTRSQSPDITGTPPPKEPTKEIKTPLPVTDEKSGYFNRYDKKAIGRDKQEEESPIVPKKLFQSPHGNAGVPASDRVESSYIEDVNDAPRSPPASSKKTATSKDTTAKKKNDKSTEKESGKRKRKAESDSEQEEEPAPAPAPEPSQPVQDEEAPASLSQVITPSEQQAANVNAPPLQKPPARKPAPVIAPITTSPDAAPSAPIPSASSAFTAPAPETASKIGKIGEQGQKAAAAARERLADFRERQQKEISDLKAKEKQKIQKAEEKIQGCYKRVKEAYATFLEESSVASDDVARAFQDLTSLQTNYYESLQQIKQRHLKIESDMKLEVMQNEVATLREGMDFFREELTRATSVITNRDATHTRKSDGDEHNNNNTRYDETASQHGAPNKQTNNNNNNKKARHSR